MSHPTASQVRRADFVLSLLDGSTVKAAVKKLHIKGKKFVQRVKASLQRDCSLADAPRPGRPVIYTATTLDQALDWFQHHDFQLLTKQKLVEELELEGILPSDTSTSGFYHAFKSHLLTYGFELKWGQRTLTFALTRQHQIWRTEWCLAHKAALTLALLVGIWFCDEIVIEESGHPKGEVCCIQHGRAAQFLMQAGSTYPQCMGQLYDGGNAPLIRGAYLPPASGSTPALVLHASAQLFSAG